MRRIQIKIKLEKNNIITMSNLEEASPKENIPCYAKKCGSSLEEEQELD